MIVRAIRDSCADHSEEMNTLHLNCCGNEQINFNFKLTDSDLKALCFCLENFINFLVHIDLSFNLITENSVLSISRVIAEATNLKTIILRGNSLKGECIDMLISSLEMSDTLRILDLSGNEIGVECFSSISKFLMNNESLLDLDLSNNNMDINCLIELVSVLNLYNKTLRIIKLDNFKTKEVGQDVFFHLSKMAKNNNVLESLSLRKFNLRYDGL